MAPFADRLEVRYNDVYERILGLVYELERAGLVKDNAWMVSQTRARPRLTCAGRRESPRI